MTEIINDTYVNKHTFLTFAKDIVNTFFNVMAKNYVSNMNDKIHVGKKRITPTISCGYDARNIKRLTSN